MKVDEEELIRLFLMKEGVRIVDEADEEMWKSGYVEEP